MFTKDKRIIILIIFIVVVLVIGIINYFISINKINTNQLTGTVLSQNSSEIIIQDDNNIIYTFATNNLDANVGDSILIEYTGLLDKNTNIQDCEIISYSIITSSDTSIPTEWLDDGIFSNYYTMAYNKMMSLSLKERIAQLLLVRYPDSMQTELLQKYGFAGYVFYEKDFKDKTESEVQNMINELQKSSNIPILTAVDEEGGTVVRISSNSNLVSETFKSPSELYTSGGFAAIKNDTINKSSVLKNLGINLNLAPVVDVSTNSSDYMYERTLKQNTTLTSTYARTVISASKDTGVSYTLKHFPGYGNNSDTHTGSSIDNRSYESIMENDIPPFEAGIDAGAEAILVSHNIVTSIDSTNPASLSTSIHNLLRNSLSFTGIIITDDMDMGATSDIDNAVVLALLAGNDLIIVTDYEESMNQIETAINNEEISEELINKLCFRILAWKYYKGMLIDNQK